MVTFRTTILEVIFKPFLLAIKIGKQARIVLGWLSETLLVWKRAYMAMFVMARGLLVRLLNTQSTIAG